MKLQTRLLSLFALLGMLAGLGLTTSGRAADDEKGLLASVLSRALSTPASRVSIGAIEGALSSDATIRNIEISDRDGVWLKVDRAHIVWRRLALLQRRLEVDTLEVDHLEVARRPIPAETPVAGEDQPLLPELPLRIEVKDFKLAELALGEPVLGTAARLTASGAARLGNPSEGLDLHFDARRLDQPGTATARLSLVPQGQRLDLNLAVDEPAGGVLVHLANIPGLPPVNLELRGQGTLDDFQAKLAFAAGPGIGANGTATLRREGPARRLGLDLSAEIAGLLPQVAAPVFAGTTRLSGGALIADDGAVTIPGITLAAAAARLDLTGGLDAHQVADLHVTATNVPTSGARTAVAGAEIRELAFNGHVTGALTSPQVDATLSAADARLPAGRVAKLEASLTASPTGAVTQADTRVRLKADARATGLALTDPALAQAVGSEARLTLRGTTTVNGVLDLDTLELASPTLTGRFSGRAGSSELKGRLAVDAPDLSRFGEVAGLALAGRAAATADVEGTPRANRYTAQINATASGFASGIKPIDGLYGGRLELKGGAHLDPDGGFGFQDLLLTGPNAQARVNGSATPTAADITALLTVPNLARADSRLSGRGQIDAHVTGTLAHPDATATASVTGATALGRPVPRLVVKADAKDLRGTLDARVSLDGEIDRKPARGSLHVARPQDGGTVLDDLDVTVGSATAKGAVTLDAHNLAAGQLSVSARNLDDLSPLVLQRLQGSLEADIRLAVANGGQNAQLKASAQHLRAESVALDRLQADLALTDVYRRPIVAGSAAVDDARIADEAISRIRLNATGTAQASDVILTATARGFDLDARARIVPSEPTRIELTQFGAVRDGRRIALAAPATFTLVDGGVAIRGFALGFGTGRLAIDGTAGSRLDLRARATAVPLSAAAILAPRLALAGTLEGEADLGGTAQAPTGSYRLRVSRLANADSRNFGLPPIDITAAGRLEGQRATLDATIAAGTAGTLRLGGSVPLSSSGALDVTVRGNLDAAVANRTLGAAGRRAAGKVAVDARIGGTTTSPDASGSATLSNGLFQDATQGIRLEKARARFVARGDLVTIEDASASTPNGGTIAATGQIRIASAAGFPGTIRITGRQAQLVHSALMTAVANLDLDLSGPLARDPRIAGRIGVVSLDVTVPERLPATLQPLPGTRHLHPTRTAAARLALERRGRGPKAPPPFNAILDLTVAAPGHITIHGRGLDAELGGSLRLTGTLAKPNPVGAFSLVRGRLKILTTQLDFTRANLTFTGDLSPELDFLATTQAGGAQIGVAVTGVASEPQFTFTSSPDMPQDEVLSRLLFGAPAGQLSAFQALALAQAAAQYAGDGNGAFEDLRKSLGLSGLDIGLGSGGLGVGLTRALGDRVHVGVRAGSSAADTGIGADLNLTDRIKIQGQVGANGGARVGIGSEYEW